MLAIALVTVGFVAVLFSIPQFFQLLNTKRADEFSLATWLIWILYHITALTYTISINAYAYSSVNLLWVLFYSSMAIMIIRYKINPGKSKPRRKTKKSRVN